MTASLWRVRYRCGFAGERQRVVHACRWDPANQVWVSLCGLTLDPRHVERADGGMPCMHCVAHAQRLTAASNPPAGPGARNRRLPG